MIETSPYQCALEIAKSPLFIKRNFVYPKSLTFQYAFYRIARPVLKLNYKIFKLFNPVRPWTTQASIKIFDKILSKNMVGFEYGSGNSTIFFAGKLRHLTSVEHDSTWYDIVKNKFQDLKIDNVDYHIIPRVDKNNSHSHAYTFYQDYNLNENSFQIMEHYHDYFSFIKKYPENHFDFIIVDGRARIECTLNALSKLKPGGIYVLDNADRERYKPIFEVLKSWQKINTTTGLFDTTIWFKPKKS